MEKIFKEYGSINKLVNGYRTFALITVVLSLVLCLTMGVLIFIVSQNKIMVVDGEGDILSASKSSEKELFNIEADNHIRLFYSRFFTYDKSNYKNQVNLGLLMAGKSAANLYETYSLKGWFDNVISNDLKVDSYVQKVSFSNIDGVVSFNVVGFQTITRGDISEKRHLDIKGTVYLKSSGREVVTNPHGMEIDNINITNNATIQSVEPVNENSEL